MREQIMKLEARTKKAGKKITPDQLKQVTRGRGQGQGGGGGDGDRRVELPVNRVANAYTL